MFNVGGLGASALAVVLLPLKEWQTWPQEERDNQS